MIGDLKEIISQAQMDLPHAGVVVYDCNQHDIFYIPQSQLESFEEDLSEIDCVRFNAVKAKYSEEDAIVMITFHNSEIIDITNYDEQKNFAPSCPIAD